MSDRLTKLILITIALGLLANAAVTIVRPTPAAAVDDLCASSLQTMADALRHIQYGDCANLKLCEKWYLAALFEGRIQQCVKDVLRIAYKTEDFSQAKARIEQLHRR